MLVAAIVALCAGLTGGCAKKSVMPPTVNTSASGGAGKDINYPAAEGYSENNLAREGRLDDSASARVEHLGSMALDGTGGQSDEYKRMHGRTTDGMIPVYFDFDQAAVKPDMAERMVQNSEYIKQIPNTIVIEGNCDDRGTKEYNLALGEKRAINVRDYLVNLGINPARIRTLSYGEERPLFLEQDESAWSQNRRADFVVE